ncbi:MAG TPA: hypothetical protein VMB71_00390 [Acetobacteraceae bacterium]|nr:hypothetical protein [Acetobacteraceae bacterium]
MIRHIATISLAMSLVSSGFAFAAKCPVAGTWKDTNYGETFVMKSNKKGTAGANPECSNENSQITTTTLSKKIWDFNITSKNCSVVITADFDFAKGSCTSASGSITIPGVGTLPDSINKTATARRSPPPAQSTLGSGLK